MGLLLDRQPTTASGAEAGTGVGPGRSQLHGQETRERGSGRPLGLFLAHREILLQHKIRS
jgi:hypothetical protein